MFLLKFLFPPYCLLCNSYSDYLCSICMKNLIYTLPQCIKCRSISNYGLTHKHCNCTISSLFTGYRYTKEGKNILKRIKYDYAYRLLPYLINDLRIRIEFYLNHFKIQNTILLSIPLHYSKYLSRGFNQAELIGIEISKISGIYLNTTLLTRKSRSSPQSKVEYKKRGSNVRGIFKTNMENLKNIADIILIDDVVTSGSTFLSAAKEIRKTYPEISVHALTLFNGLRKISNKVVN